MSIFSANPAPHQQYVLCPACGQVVLPLLPLQGKLVAFHDCSSFRGWDNEKRWREVYYTDQPLPGEWAVGAIQFVETVNRSLPNMPARGGYVCDVSRYYDLQPGSSEWQRQRLNSWGPSPLEKPLLTNLAFRHLIIAALGVPPWYIDPAAGLGWSDPKPPAPDGQVP